MTKNHATIAGVRTAVQTLVMTGLYAGVSALGIDGLYRAEVLAVAGPLAVGAVAFGFNLLERRLPVLTKFFSLGLAAQAADYGKTTPE